MLANADSKVGEEKALPLKERPERQPIDGRASLRCGDNYSVKIRMRNLSKRGFMAECSEPVRIGSSVSLDVPGIGTVDAQVRWQLGREMGGQFVDPISLGGCEWTATRLDLANQQL